MGVLKVVNPKRIHWVKFPPSRSGNMGSYNVFKNTSREWNSVDNGIRILMHTEHDKRFKLKTALNYCHVYLLRGEPGTFYYASNVKGRHDIDMI